MVHVCCVPGCSNRSNREAHLSYFSLPLTNKRLLKIWVHKIGRTNLQRNSTTRVCSDHFVLAAKRKLRPDEYPTQNLPTRSHTTPARPRKPPRPRTVPEPFSETDSDEQDTPERRSIGIQVCDDSPVKITYLKDTVKALEAEILQLQETVTSLKGEISASKFCIENVCKDDQDVTFYTGFPSLVHLKSCYDYLGPAVDGLKYWGSNDKEAGHGRKRTLSSYNEFFMLLHRLRLGLLEKDLANRFKVSVPTVCRILRTWMRFMYLHFKEIPLWPSRELVNAYMPKCFKDLYPTTRVIVDATEIYVETPALPDFQQMTFSSYKNGNTFKVLVGISPGGAVTFVSKLYPGSITDQMLTKKSGLLDLLEKGDSVMAD